MEAVLPAEPGWDVPLRFFAALKYLVLAGEEPALARALAGQAELGAAVEDVLRRRSDWVARFVREHGVQTNDPRRCWTLLPAFLMALASWSGPVDLVELGPSAGLNLVWDRYRYRYGDVVWGPRESPFELTGVAHGALPRDLFARDVAIRRRVGIDQAPVDATTEDGERLLLAFARTDGLHRGAHLRRAIDVLRQTPPELVRGDYTAELPAMLHDADPDALTLVFDTASTAYVDDEAYAGLAAEIADAGRRVPLAWVSLEPERGTRFPFVLTLQTWPSGRRMRLAEAKVHGAALRWLA